MNDRFQNVQFCLLIDQLCSCIEQLLKTKPDFLRELDFHELEGLRGHVQSARGGYPCIMNELAAFDIDRLGSVVLGPVFTSEAHPWPEDENGTPLVPLLQLNSDLFPRPLHNDVNGLIQVWLCVGDISGDKTQVRVVPACDVDVAALSPIIATDDKLDVLLSDAINWLRCFHLGRRQSKQEHLAAAAAQGGFSSADDMADEDWAAWCQASDSYDQKYGIDVEVCWQITQYEGESIYCAVTHDERKIVEKLRNLTKKVDEISAAYLRELVEAFDALMEIRVSSAFPCLFGTFEEIQYFAADCALPVLCMESIGLREWGDGGNAQVFFDDCGEFYFKWSCS